MNSQPEKCDIDLPYGDHKITFSLPAQNLLAVISPNPLAPCADPLAEMRRALRHPIGAPPLAQAARGASRVAIVADDLTRQTPVQLLIPLLLDELNAAGISDEQVVVIIALGTHRPMTSEEIRERFGDPVLGRVRALNNPWQDPSQMIDLGLTANGTPTQISRLVMEADFVIGLGSIVPHHIPGFSGGAKIIQPGVSGAATTGATHLLSTRASGSYLGTAENPVRAEMEAIAERAGLKAIFNVVLNSQGLLVGAFYGHPRQAHRAGVALAVQVYGVKLPGPADIVIASSHPCDLEFWQAHKALYPAELALRAGGDMIVVTPSPEGVSVMHSEMLNFTALPPERIDAGIQDGTIRDVVSGALALAWAKIRQRAAVGLVSEGVSAAEARALGFSPYASLQEALESALRCHGPGAKVTVLTHAPDTLPLLSS
ncbi:MAG: nickel-dependent lactate racemase [Anaerolineales bacterium]|nr:nickel-dependent lactate racemase [Anaerolineales bacterium]